jgi:hypothetical protein
VSARRPFLAALSAALALAVVVPGAAAHPLGNFTVNHLSTVRISDDSVEIGYVLDEAEIPTVQNKRLSDDELIRQKTEAILEGLEPDGGRGRGGPTS